MKIKSLEISNLRIIQGARLELGGRLNLFIGDNGAGKTSVLEALVILAKGRSFRGGPVGAVTGRHEESFRVLAEVTDQHQHVHRLGLERGAKQWRGRIDGQEAQQLTDFSRYLPLVLLEPNSHLLISGPPEARRRFMDWGVFHVKHEFLSLWRRYLRALRQRNAALRAGQRALAKSLDPQLARYGETLHEGRVAHLDRLMQDMGDILARLSPALAWVRARYRSGWPEVPLAEALENRLATDLERGSTSVGPHRADLALIGDQGSARDRLSRGEQKVVAVAMMLAQATLLTRQGVRPVLLLDDLASEFDRHHLRSVIELARELELQCLITGVEAEPFERLGSSPGARRGVEGEPAGVTMFHVKQGDIRRAPEDWQWGSPLDERSHKPPQPG